MFKILLHFHAQKAFETCTLCHNIVAICVVTMYSGYRLNQAEQARQPEAEASQGLFALLI